MVTSASGFHAEAPVDHLIEVVAQPYAGTAIARAWRVFAGSDTCEERAFRDAAVVRRSAASHLTRWKCEHGRFYRASVFRPQRSRPSIASRSAAVSILSIVCAPSAIWIDREEGRAAGQLMAAVRSIAAVN